MVCSDQILLADFSEKSVNASYTQAGPGITMPDGFEAFELTKAHQIIKKLPSLLRSWGMYAYTYQQTKTDVRRIRDEVYSWWHKNKGGEFAGNFTMTGRHLTLVHLAMEDMKHRFATKQEKYSKTELAYYLDIQKQNWDRDRWDQRFLAIESHIDEIDNKALAPLAKMLDERDLACG